MRGLALLLLALGGAGACGVGQFYPLSNLSACSACSGNTYCALPTGCAGNCTACPLQTSADANHTTCLSANCAPCPQGSFCGGGTTISGCPVGTYGSAPGLGSATQCTACAAGAFTGGANATICSLCSAGNYSLTGSSVCSLCAAGAYATGLGTPLCSL